MVSGVTCTGFEPSAFMTQMWSASVRSLANAIWAPSGENTGRSEAREVVVSWVGLVPFGLTTQRWSRPVWLLVNAIFVPSGDQFGFSSKHPGLLVTWTGLVPF